MGRRRGGREKNMLKRKKKEPRKSAVLVPKALKMSQHIVKRK